MPVTPYHFGPSALTGYIFRKRLDFPVFVLANVIVDIEVLLIGYFKLGWPYHRYAHTLIGGAAVGLLWGVIAYLLQPILKWGMHIIRINYTPKFKTMLISGVLGVWTHVLVDAVYHYDVKIFWPFPKNILWRIVYQEQVKLICLICLGVFIVLYMLPTFKQFLKKR
jgi:membrane-bound metal-dependent hydrolase YbcI (DUF457 family)